MHLRDLLEAPLADFGTFGDTDTEGSLRATDLRMVNNPKWQLRVQNAFKNTPYKFNIYLYNGPQGRVNIIPQSKWATEKIDVRDLKNLRRYAGVQSLDFVAATIGKMPPDAHDSITVLLVENEGDARMPLTPWILAHRVAHAIFDAGQEDYRTIPEVAHRVSNVFRAMSDFINSDKLSLLLRDHDMATGLDRVNAIARSLTTFRSGRMGKLANIGELVVESFTQYLVQGRVTYQHPELSGGRTPVEGEEKRLLHIARREMSSYSRRMDQFVEFIMMNERDAAGNLLYRSFFAGKQPQTEWLIYNADGGLVTSERDPEDAEYYRNRGYRVVERKPSRALMKKFQPFFARKTELETMYKRWVQNKMLAPTPTDDLDDLIDDTVRRLHFQFNEMLKACVGHALVL